MVIPVYMQHIVFLDVLLYKYISYLKAYFHSLLKMSDYHLLSDATPLSKVNQLELGFRVLRKTVERKLGKKEDPSIVKVIFDIRLI